ncbi:hypothetical protein ACFOHT_04700 [Massilia oculi]|uniref:hypothetical protein n=1 Tax=Massilia oculi TaxID=945844 RepID=UPI0013B35D1D|nr:hypothetical protein [Massilia oculi]
MNAADHGHLCELADAAAEALTDLQIVDALVEAFDLPALAIIERLGSLDFAAVRGEVMP